MAEEMTATEEIGATEGAGDTDEPGATDEPAAEFTRRTEPFRDELLAYCYRMLGALHDAEDLVQEVYLRAWRSWGGFEGRSSARTWLYRIATNACLNALRHSSRRALPSGLGNPAEELPRANQRAPEATWLQPFPDRLLTAPSDDPAAVVATRAGIRLAFVAALQHLPQQQRAVLILREALGWHAAEVADLLGTTPAAVNSSLQRARAQIERLAPASDQVAEPSDARRRELLDRYVSAFENADIDALGGLLTDDTVWEMPPVEAWYLGRESVLRLVAARWSPRPGGSRLLPTAANGMPAFGYYRDGAASSIQVLTLTEAGISHVVGFHDASLLPRFGLPPEVGLHPRVESTFPPRA
jgi:RNA polymerase sigma-70 factor (ECF subfamily)